MALSLNSQVCSVCYALCSSFVGSGDELVFLLIDAKAVILQLEEECTALHKTGR